MVRPNFIEPLDFELLLKKYSEEELENVVEKIKNDYPVQYLIGDVVFLDTKILVDERVLIPRFETELLVYNLKKYIEQKKMETGNFLDVCTGSGCIGIALKKQFPKANVVGIDKSRDALVVAKENSTLNGVDVSFLEEDIFTNFSVPFKVDVLVSNPPYVKLGEEVSANTKYEPSMALYPGEDDTIFYKRIIDESIKFMNDDFIIAFEIGSTQGEEIEKYAKNIYKNASVLIEKDYNGYDRFVYIFSKSE